MIPKTHPRYKSLLLRDKVKNAFKEGYLADSGMIAHGRGETFDYLIGEKTITISDKEVKIRTSAALPRLYRIKFGRDIFKDLLGLKNEIQSGEETLPTEALEIFENIAYIMAAHADPSVSGNVSEWLEQFETFDIYKVLPEILTLWGAETEQTSSAKKENEQ